LKRIYIGLESGSPELLYYLSKPITPDKVIDAVKSIKAAGIAVGIIVLLGAGGSVYSQKHIQETTSVLNAMDLGMDDIIYFSELVESEGMAYTSRAFDDGLYPLSGTEIIQQENKIFEALTFSESGGTPHISRYDIREFIY
jgi:radical SAM superfamily enzyme YgiQ (UPF0313 family)